MDVTLAATNQTPVDRSPRGGDQPGGPSWFIRPKGHIGPISLLVLMALGCLPFVFVATRILAMPSGGPWPLGGATALSGIGDFLNRSVTFDWVPTDARPKVFYLLLIPTGAMIVAFARLTLGTRVLGLRAILLAIGFRAIGFGPSMALLFVVVGIVVMFRPWTRKIRLPLYGRIAAILCLSAMIMVGALLIAPTLRSEAVWSVAFFPAIIMAMLADAVAKTLERDDVVMTVWRLGWTVIVAIFIALVAGFASETTFHFPELIMSTLIAVVFIGEYFDLRLLEAWPARISRYLAGEPSWLNARPKIAVVRNRSEPDVLGRLGRAAPPNAGLKSIQPHIDALRREGYKVKVFEGDKNLIKRLGAFMPSHPRTGVASGVVLNLATGVQGEGRFSHVPALLEMAGVPYTGPDPLAQACLGDRLALLMILERNGIQVPKFRAVEPDSDGRGFDYPVSVRPRFEPDVNRTVVRRRRKLLQAIEELQQVSNGAAVVEAVVPGRDVHAVVLGNDELECLPLLERMPRRKGVVCPAQLSDDVSDRIRSVACAAFRVAGCRDFGRVRLRVTDAGDVVVIDVRWTPAFARRGAIATAAEAAGYTFDEFMARIVGEAERRLRDHGLRGPDAIRPA